jgi:nucleoside-diphosphate kinase
MERTLIILKPDTVQRGLVGRVISRFEDKGLKIVGLKMMKVDAALAARLYSVHKGKHF